MAGEHISTSLTNALKLASEQDTLIEITFNNKVIRVDKYSNLEFLFTDWNNCQYLGRRVIGPRAYKYTEKMFERMDKSILRSKKRQEKETYKNLRKNNKIKMLLESKIVNEEFEFLFPLSYKAEYIKTISVNEHDNYSMAILTAVINLGKLLQHLNFPKLSKDERIEKYNISLSMIDYDGLSGYQMRIVESLLKRWWKYKKYLI